jgi:hypothetical protein
MYPSGSIQLRHVTVKSVTERIPLSGVIEQEPPDGNLFIKIVIEDEVERVLFRVPLKIATKVNFQNTVVASKLNISLETINSFDEYALMNSGLLGIYSIQFSLYVRLVRRYTLK